MKRKIFVLLFLTPLLILAQQEDTERELKLLKDKNLIEAVYFHDNGNIKQKGTYNLEGALHGDWVSFTPEGEKLSMGNYLNGKKHGKWFFWDKDLLREVDYNENEIASVQEWKEGVKCAFQR